MTARYYNISLWGLPEGYNQTQMGLIRQSEKKGCDGGNRRKATSLPIIPVG